MGTGIELAALALMGYGMHEQNRAQKKAAKQQESIAKREANKAPDVATEQKKVDETIKMRSALQNSLLAGARKSSIATGGSTLG